jgi:uncharacterized protein YidB (DUF937 family)
MLALLGLLAVAGYQNRDKLGELLGQLTGGGAAGGAGNNSLPGQQAGSGAPAGGAAGGGILGGLGGILGGLLGQAPSPAQTSGGLRDIVNSFNEHGHADTVGSWVQPGSNKPVQTSELEEALGSDTIDALAEKTGLSRDDILSRLSTVLPSAVDGLTPGGRLPS